MRVNLNNNAPLDIVVIMAAMESEAEPLAKEFDLHQIETSAIGLEDNCLKAYRGVINNRTVYLIQNGKDPLYDVERVGPLAAAETTAHVIAALKPNLIISAGVAGGVKKADSKIGDVFVSDDKIVFCDRVIKSINNPNYRNYGRGYYDCLPVNLVAKQAGVIPGIIATGSSLDPSQRDIEELEMLAAKAVDMEAAAIAYVAQRMLITEKGKVIYKSRAVFDRQSRQTATPVNFMAAKAVVNFLDNELHNDMRDNFNIAISELAKKISLLLSSIVGKKPSEIALPKAKL